MLQRPLLNANDTFMLQSPQNVTKATIGYIIWDRGGDVDHYALYKVHIEDVTSSTFMLQKTSQCKCHIYVTEFTSCYIGNDGVLGLLCTLFRLNWAKQTPGIMRQN